MRYIFNLLIVLVVSLSFVQVSYSEKPKGEIWNEMSFTSKGFYVVGFLNGLNSGSMEAIKYCYPEKTTQEQLIENLKVQKYSKIFTMSEKNEYSSFDIVHTINNLYNQNSDNVYIDIDEMIKFSIRKLKGEDILNEVNVMRIVSEITYRILKEKGYD